jgi:hypothetical protein
MNDLKKDTNKIFWVPLPLVKLVTEKPEATIFLLLKLYEKSYPNADVSEYYEAIDQYLTDVKFELEHYTDEPTGEIN